MLGIKGKGKETRNIIKRVLLSPTDSCEKDMQESSFIFLSFKKLLFSRSFFRDSLLWGRNKSALGRMGEDNGFSPRKDTKFALCA